MINLKKMIIQSNQSCASFLAGIKNPVLCLVYTANNTSTKPTNKLRAVL